MRDGKIVQSGTIADLVESPREDFVERFVRAQRTVTRGLVNETLFIRHRPAFAIIANVRCRSCAEPQHHDWVQELHRIRHSG
jgi:ABC-type proline/glycine betaine transport system ATPase subunit